VNELALKMYTCVSLFDISLPINVFPGKAGELIDRGDNTYGGKFVINPSGGLISKGHPLGATGMYLVAASTVTCKTGC
jgi:acetyl-CoA acetyltransferase